MKNVPEVISILKKDYPDAKIALHFEGNWQLLVAVILSAQCTDVRVNKVTPPLFERFPTVEDFAKCKIEDLEKMIFSTGFYRNKAKNIKAAAQMLVTEHAGKVPSSMEELLALPGVARKTANVVLYSGFGKTVGIVVDTHVARLAGKLGWVSEELSKKKSAVKIEKKLMKIIPESDWGIIAHLLILHGRNICIARRPKCLDCPLNRICPGVEL